MNKVFGMSIIIKLHKPKPKASPQAVPEAPAEVPAQGSAAKLLALVRQVVESDPYAAEGFAWASRPQEWWAERVGCSTKQIQRLSHGPPFRWARKLVDGRPRVLLREGFADDPKAPEEYARPMVKVWRKHGRTKDKETPADYGRLVELGKHWKALGPAILQTVLDDWSGFMMTVLGHQLEAGEGEEAKKYYDFPSTGVILRHRPLAYGLHMHKLQWEQGDKLVKDLKATG